MNFDHDIGIDFEGKFDNGEMKNKMQVGSNQLPTLLAFIVMVRFCSAGNADF